jgi:hypothetical protein
MEDKKLGLRVASLPNADKPMLQFYGIMAEMERLAKLEAIAEKLKRGENVQNRHLQTWLSEDGYAQIEVM